MNPPALMVALAWTGLAASGPLMPAAESLRAVSTASLTNRSGAGGSFAPSFSADGRFLVFLSQANNLVTNDDLAPNLDVLRHDLTSGNTALVSVN